VQKFWSILFGGVMAGSLLLFIVAGAGLAQGWWLPKNVATFGPDIDNLFYLILGITGFFFVLTEGILVYSMWRFAGQPGRKSSYTHGNHRLELTWTFVPGVILLLLAIVQINVWLHVKDKKNMWLHIKDAGEARASTEKTDELAQQMEVIARQWEWRVRYPGSKRMESWARDPNLAKDFAQNPHLDDVHLTNEIHTWKGTADKSHRVLIHLRTLDVIHSFFLPNLRLKQDALPGKTIPVWFAVNEHNTRAITNPATNKKERWVEIGYDPVTGQISDASTIWELACAEFCGARHSLMRGKLYVHETEADFMDWLRSAEAGQNQTTIAAR
jgi:cytochrome c oxidase subunit 2